MKEDWRVCREQEVRKQEGFGFDINHLRDAWGPWPALDLLLQHFNGDSHHSARKTILQSLRKGSDISEALFNDS